MSANASRVADPACECEMGWQCDFCRQFARGYNGADNAQLAPERSVLSKTIARMVDPCPGCGHSVRGEQQVARPGPASPWWHEGCFDTTHATPNPGIDETARDHDAEALADLGDVGDLDQYDRSTQ